eukprot:6203896-Pleurochrysis_carterae.AAC.1
MLFTFSRFIEGDVPMKIASVTYRLPSTIRSPQCLASSSNSMKSVPVFVVITAGEVVSDTCGSLLTIESAYTTAHDSVPDVTAEVDRCVIDPVTERS